MPSSITHAFFALDVYDNLDIKIQKRISNNIEEYKTFAQGPDPLFFYNLSNFGKGKNIRSKYPTLIQTKYTQKFFIELISYIKENKLENNPEILSFLYGFITHYVLDSTIHPFIIYKTGIFDKNNSDTYKYNGLHNDMEVYIDAYMIFQREKTFPKDFKTYKFICNIDNFSDKLNNLLDTVFKDVYDINDFSKLYHKAIKQMKFIFRVYRYDKFGIKKVGYKIIDAILPKKYLKKEMLSYHVGHNSKKHYLNLEKNEWNHPTNKYEYYTYSFIELYRIALDKAKSIINDVNDVLYEGENVKTLKKTFTNLSYETGKDCELEEKCQYFEF